MDVAERRMPGRCAVDATYRIEQAEQTIRKRSDNQIDRTRILEVRIQSPPAKKSSANGKWRRPAPPSFNVEQQLPEVDVGAPGTAHSVLPSIEPKKARHIYLSRPSRNQTGFRTSSTLGRTGYFWMICRFTSARIFPQRECKLNQPNGFEPLRPADDRIIRVFWPINFAHNR